MIGALGLVAAAILGGVFMLLKPDPGPLIRPARQCGTAMRARYRHTYAERSGRNGWLSARFRVSGRQARRRFFGRPTMAICLFGT